MEPSDLTATPHGFEEMRVNGKTIQAPALSFKNRRIVAAGKWVKLAAVKDEQVCEGELVDAPEALVAELKRARFKADILNFPQALSQTAPKYSHHLEWDNAAVISTKSYEQWWNKLSQDTRRNVRRAAKMGVTLRTVPFSDGLVNGIIEIYNETPIRQGKPFWHYGKSFEIVKKECATYLERSKFIGAYHENALIGFCKLTYADDCAHVIHILSKEAHSDKRPTNALIAKAVEICAGKGLSYLTYCRYLDGGNEQSPLTEFKRRNGFEQLLYPRYFIPLNLKGKLALKLGLHHGLRNRLPKSWIPFLLRIRARVVSAFYRKRSGRSLGTEERQARAGVRPSSAAAILETRESSRESRVHGNAKLAAAEDGRTPASDETGRAMSIAAPSKACEQGGYR